MCLCYCFGDEQEGAIRQVISLLSNVFLGHLLYQYYSMFVPDKHSNYVLFDELLLRRHCFVSMLNCKQDPGAILHEKTNFELQRCCDVHQYRAINEQHLSGTDPHFWEYRFESLVQLKHPVLVLRGVAHVCAISILLAEVCVVLPERQALIPSIHDGDAQTSHDRQSNFVPPTSFRYNLQLHGGDIRPKAGTDLYLCMLSTGRSYKEYLLPFSD